ncbi:hypothetical protein FDP41_005943 [Naegleria fowleri]|uniref:CID domain-containing protein n=1 Tax=Naegleria fowleri TaxID=5763 RepID=A0A6A5BMG8_NAEFO|nr:uncharacterized protein FDP41_005943 [Naegleria fowleri]KAF0975190.1 hypothetical protein FDP41_005943 [Naegleria fowleri]
MNPNVSATATTGSKDRNTSSLMRTKPSSATTSLLRKPSAQTMREEKKFEEKIPESVKEFSLALQRDLKINSLYDIQNLTNIAREEIHNAKYIAKAICTRIKTASDDEKLPSLYLLDSIAKNVGGVYITEFTTNLVDVFYYSFKAQTNVETQTKYLKLLKTWEPIFGHQLAHTIEEKIMRLPAYGPNQVQDYAKLVQSHSNASIYVNPKKFAKQTSIDFSKVGNMNPLITPTPAFQSPYSSQSGSLVQGNSSQSNSAMMNARPSVPATSSSSSDLNWLVQLLNKTTTATPTTQTNPKEEHDTRVVENKLVNKLYMYSCNNSKKCHFCKHCGFGFPNKQLLTQHTNYSALHKVKSSNATTSPKVFSRSWFDQSDDEWASSKSCDSERVSILCLNANSIFGESINSSSPTRNSSSDEEKDFSSKVLAPLDQDDCVICGDSFERILDDSSGEWMIKNACFDPNTGSFVHCACFNPKKRSHSSHDSIHSEKRIKFV